MRDELLRIIGEMPSVCLQAEVLEVDTSGFMCKVKPVKSEFINVPLQAADTDTHKGLILIPKVGSIVLIAILDEKDGAAVVIHTTEVDKLLLKIGEIKVEATTSDIVFNDGNNGGIVKWKELKVQIEHIKAFCDGLKAVFDAWIPVQNDGGLALKTLLSSALPNLQTGNFDGLEDSKVKH